MRRALSALLLTLSLAPGTWFYETRPPRDTRLAISIEPVALPPKAAQARDLGEFELEGVWSLSSGYYAFGGYSALLTRTGGRLLAIGDSAQWLEFSPPGAPPAPPRAGSVMQAGRKRDRDIEAATQDPRTGTIWTAREDSNAIARHDPALRGFDSVRPEAMRSWRANRGPEAMVRLADGRFIVLDESTTGPFERRLHRAVLFPRDPLVGDEALRFTFAAPPGYAPTDMAELPDGRVLVVLRRLVWLLPLRFTGRLVVADPAEIRPGRTWSGREVARLTNALPVDNFEAMAIAPRGDGRVTVWLMSDDNYAATQRTLLWKLALDPAHLPRARKKARK